MGEIESLSDGIGVGRRGAGFGVHVCQLGLDELVVGDRGGELFSGVGVWEDEVEGGAHDARKREKSESDARVYVFGRVKNCAYPSGPALSTNLSMSSPSMRTLTPPFTWPRMFFCGTKTSSKTSSPVLDPLMPSLSSFRAQEKPFDSVSTRKAVIPLEALSGSVFA